MRLDLCHAYHLLRVTAGDEYKTAFCSRYGSYNFRVIPEGLSNAPAAFQCFLNTLFVDLLDVYVMVYLDNILVCSENPADHTDHVCEVLRRLREAGLFKYLGYILSPNGFRMAPDKISTITDWLVPHKVKDIQSFSVFVTSIGASSMVILASLSRLLGSLIQLSSGIGWPLGLQHSQACIYGCSGSPSLGTRLSDHGQDRCIRLRYHGHSLHSWR
jgi:hypothetical protein